MIHMPVQSINRIIALGTFSLQVTAHPVFNVKNINWIILNVTTKLIVRLPLLDTTLWNSFLMMYYRRGAHKESILRQLL